MYYVYLLQGDKEKIYVGYTNDLKRRLHEHLRGKTYTTKRIRNIKLIYYEAYLSQEKAEVREKKLKQYGSSYQGLLKRLGLNRGRSSTAE